METQYLCKPVPSGFYMVEEQQRGKRGGLYVSPMVLVLNAALDLTGPFNLLAGARINKGNS